MKNTVLSALLVFSLFATAQNLTQGLKVHYNFESNGLDSSPQANNLTFSPSPVYSAFFGNDMALKLNGTSGGVQVNNFNNSSFTQTSVALWFKATNPNNNQQDQTLVQGAYAGFGVALNNQSGKLKVFFANSSFNSFLSPGNYIDSNWHHLVAQNNGTKTSLYVDGKFIGSLIQNYSNGNGSSSQKYIYIGKTNLNTRFFEGELNDVRIYDRILTQSEINLLSTFPTTTGIADRQLEKEMQVNVYPNPTLGNLQIETANVPTNTVLSIKNMLGQTVNSQILKNNLTHSINLEGESGIYFLELLTPSDKRVVKKLIKL